MSWRRSLDTHRSVSDQCRRIRGCRVPDFGRSRSRLSERRRRHQRLRSFLQPPRPLNRYYTPNSASTCRFPKSRPPLIVSVWVRTGPQKWGEMGENLPLAVVRGGNRGGKSSASEGSAPGCGHPLRKASLASLPGCAAYLSGQLTEQLDPAVQGDAPSTLDAFPARLSLACPVRRSRSQCPATDP